MRDKYLLELELDLIGSVIKAVEVEGSSKYAIFLTYLHLLSELGAYGGEEDEKVRLLKNLERNVAYLKSKTPM